MLESTAEIKGKGLDPVKNVNRHPPPLKKLLLTVARQCFCLGLSMLHVCVYIVSSNMITRITAAFSALFSSVL